MHDQALMADLMKTIQAMAIREGAAQVRTIHVSLGALSHMTPDHFREHFDAVSPGTLAEHAQVQATLMTDTTADDAQGIRLTGLELEYAD